MLFRDFKANINGKELHLVEWPGTGGTVICIHGLTANVHCWDKVAERLSPTYRVIVYDLPGRGDSANSDAGYGLRDHVHDILTITEALGLDRINLVGHSLGAAIACCFAAEHATKLERLVLVDGGMDPGPAVLAAIKPSLDRLGQIFPSFNDYLAFMCRTPFFSDWSPYWERYFYYDVAHRPDGSVVSKVDKEAVRQDVKALEETPINALHRNIITPTLVLWAPQGLVLPGAFVLSREKGEEIAALIPDSHFVTIAGANHYTILTKDQTSREIEQFLQAKGKQGR